VTFFIDIIYRFGVPNSIITDNGSQFMGRKFLEFCDKFHIRVDWAAVAHPQTNGQVERANGMILQGLKAQDFRPTKQVQSKMAPRAASGCMESQDHPKQSHWVHPVLPGLRRGGYPPYKFGILVAQSSGLR
jgi:transposase InsO family protein